jgi:hypothetical protein
MSLYYTHLLIPRRADYKAAPGQVADFFAALVELGVTSLDSGYRISTYAEQANWAEQHRVGQDPATGETIVIECWIADVRTIADIPSHLQALDEYDIIVAGLETPKLPVIRLDPQFTDARYAVDIACCLRPEGLSTSDFHNRERFLFRDFFYWRWWFPPARWGDPCKALNRTGIFTNPTTGETMEVPEAGCACSWIEFRFAKFLFPRVEHTLDLLPASVVSAAERIFQVRFAQGCRWG